MVHRLKPWLLIVLGGVILPISFCGFDQWYLTWIAFVPLLGALEGVTRRQALWRGFIYGLIANMIGYYWIPYTIHEFGHFPQILAWTFGTLLCSYQAIQYSLLAYITVRLRERGSSLLWVFPGTMVALETVFPLLFPIFMANTQHVVPLLVQAADLLGPLLITFIILLFNVSVFIALRALFRRESLPWKQVAVGPVGLALLIIYGLIRIPMVDAATAEGTELNVGVVQPSMGILEKWRDVEEGLRRHEERSLELERQGADLIIWSEAAYTAGYIRPDRDRNLRRLLVPELQTPLLAGALTIRRDEDGQRVRHNSALMVEADGDLVGTYDKTYLLAFGEYLPFGDVFPQLYSASPNTGRLQAGSSFDAVPFEFDGRRWALGVLICYEDILPRFTRDLVRHASPNLLVNMTNDAWFGDTNEPWIHMDLAKMRAIEHRRYLVRATNTGVSAIIDPVGRLTQNTEVFVQASMLDSIRLLDGGPTLYAFIGDGLGWLMLLLVGLGLVLTRRVWLRGPLPDDAGRSGVSQPAGILLAVAIYDLLSIVFVLVLTPAGWRPSIVELLLWLAAAGLMIASFVLLRQRNERGLLAAWGGTGARLVLTGLLLGTTTAQHLASVSALVGIPMTLAIFAAITLYLWNDRVTRERPQKKSEASKNTETPEKTSKKKEQKPADPPTNKDHARQDSKPSKKSQKGKKKGKRSSSSS